MGIKGLFQALKKRYGYKKTTTPIMLLEGEKIAIDVYIFIYAAKYAAYSHRNEPRDVYHPTLVTYFQKMIEIESKSIDLLLKLGCIYLILRKNIQAGECFKQTIQISPKDTNLRRGYIYCLIIAHQFDESREQMEALVKIDKTAMDLILTLFKYHISVFDFKTALNYLKKAVKIEPELKHFQYYLKEFYKEKKDYLERIRKNVEKNQERRRFRYEINSQLKKYMNS